MAAWKIVAGKSTVLKGSERRCLYLLAGSAVLRSRWPFRAPDVECDFVKALSPYGTHHYTHGLAAPKVNWFTVLSPTRIVFSVPSSSRFR